MHRFADLCQDTSKQLGRELEQREIDFLYWLHHMKEQNERLQTTGNDILKDE